MLGRAAPVQVVRQWSRRREEPHLVQQVAWWRFGKAGVNVTFRKKDMTNAFATMKREVLEKCGATKKPL